MEPKIRISGLGWLCVWDRGDWIAVVHLTEQQIREYRSFLAAHSATGHRS